MSHLNMATELSAPFGDLIAGRIRAAHDVIARRWLDRLAVMLPVERNEIFPSNQLLDHIPALINEIADYVGADSSDALIGNTLVFSKARELGELRFAQKASVHQLLREYSILATVLGTFIDEEFSALEGAWKSTDVLSVMNRLNEAVFVLLQMTVDTFVGRYTTMIEEQTSRLEGFNRMVSHELRQPLSSVQSAVDVLRQLSGHDQGDSGRMLDLADRNVKRLAQLLSMLGALARPEQDNLQLQSIDVAQVVADVFRQLRENAESRGVSLTSAVPSTMVTVDVSRFELVLVNLVSNGIKYRDASKSDACVDVSLREAEGGFQLLVRDNGLGIPLADQRQIFQRFYRAHAARDGELGTDGVGLGLSIAAECMKAMNGSLSFESTEGLGTTFTIALPGHPARPTAPEHAHDTGTGQQTA
jgi:signal transduction histidine kinase